MRALRCAIAHRGMTPSTVYRPKNPGAHADGPTLPGGRGTLAGGGGGRCTFPKKSRGAGALDWAGRGFFGFGAALDAAAVPLGKTDADGVSPFACSRPTSRRGQAKSSARPARGASGSPLTPAPPPSPPPPPPP